MIEIKRIDNNPLYLYCDYLKYGDFQTINFHRCILNKLDMSFANFTKVDFRSAEMNEVILTSAILKEGMLIMVESQDSKYDYSNLEKSKIFFSNFKNSSFKGASLQNAILNQTNLSGCDFCGANMLCEGIETCELTGLLYDEFTQWKDGFEPDKYGAKMI